LGEDGEEVDGSGAGPSAPLVASEAGSADENMGGSPRSFQMIKDANPNCAAAD
jgi:hypothetical protein